MRDETSIKVVPLVSVAVASVVEPSLNVTVPVALDGVTLAVRRTLVPNTAGLRDVLSDVVQLALFTVCMRVLLVLLV